MKKPPIRPRQPTLLEGALSYWLYCVRRKMKRGRSIAWAAENSFKKARSAGGARRREMARQNPTRSWFRPHSSAISFLSFPLPAGHLRPACSRGPGLLLLMIPRAWERSLGGGRSAGAPTRRQRSDNSEHSSGRNPATHVQKAFWGLGWDNWPPASCGGPICRGSRFIKAPRDPCLSAKKASVLPSGRVGSSISIHRRGPLRVVMRSATRV